MNRSLRSYLGAAAVVLAIVAICAVACTITALWVIRSERTDHSDGHDWIHEELGIAEGDFPELDKLEVAFDDRHNELTGEMRVAQAELSNQLLTKSEADPVVVAAIHKIHDIHGQLQELSVRHYFDMLRILPESKRQRLRELAAKSLAAPP